MTPSDQWIPVERTEVKVIGPDEEEPGKLSVRFKLVPDPRSNKWIDYFLGAWKTFPEPTKVSSGGAGLGFVGRVEDNRLEEFVATIDRCAGEANARYESEDIPKIEAESARVRDVMDAEKARIDKAQETLDNL